MSAYVSTLLGYGATLLAVVGSMFLLFWVRDRKATWLLWATMPFILGVGGNVLLIGDQFASHAWFARLGVALLLLAYGFAWQALRVFGGRPPALGWVLGPVLLWMTFSVMVAGPWQLGTASAACRGLLVALFNGLAAWELRREPGQDPPSRPVLFWMLAVFAAVGGLRACLAGILPSPLGGQPTQNWSVAAFNLFAIAEALIVSGFMIALSRERVAIANYEIALRDPLTGLANRRALDERAIVLDRDRRAGMTTVLLCDLDRFKSINDRFGHGIGDAVIRLVADTAARSLRAEGDMFRLGGEEFVCLLPGLDGDQALLRAERFRRAFAEAAATVSGHRVGATLSIGIASDRSGASTIETLLARADDALYEAKRGGRDQSVRAA